MKKRDNTYIGISFVILVFGIIFVPRIVEIPTPKVALNKPKTNATWLPSIICENTSLPSESVPRICLLEGGAGCK